MENLAGDQITGPSPSELWRVTAPVSSLSSPSKPCLSEGVTWDPAGGCTGCAWVQRAHLPSKSPTSLHLFLLSQPAEACPLARLQKASDLSPTWAFWAKSLCPRAVSWNKALVAPLAGPPTQCTSAGQGWDKLTFSLYRPQWGAVWPWYPWESQGSC